MRASQVRAALAKTKNFDADVRVMALWDLDKEVQKNNGALIEVGLCVCMCMCVHMYVCACVCMCMRVCSCECICAVVAVCVKQLCVCVCMWRRTMAR
jgi:hypothetical protein